MCQASLSFTISRSLLKLLWWVTLKTIYSSCMLLEYVLGIGVYTFRAGSSDTTIPCYVTRGLLGWALDYKDQAHFSGYCNVMFSNLGHDSGKFVVIVSKMSMNWCFFAICTQYAILSRHFFTLGIDSILLLQERVSQRKVKWLPLKFSLGEAGGLVSTTDCRNISGNCLDSKVPSHLVQNYQTFPLGT